MIRIDAYRRDQRGGSAAEFALVVPLFMMLVLGVIYLSLGVYAAVQLHSATQYTARCLAVSANNSQATRDAGRTDCPNDANVQTYGLNRYNRYTGPKLSPLFTVDNATTCTNAKQVTGAGTFRLPLGFWNISVPITAKACFPYIRGS
jgi:Flp pilus assembly protein TadG